MGKVAPENRSYCKKYLSRDIDINKILICTSKCPSRTVEYLSQVLLDLFTFLVKSADKEIYSIFYGFSIP